MLAAKSVTVRIDNETLDRFERMAKKVEKSQFRAFSNTSIQDFIRRLIVDELDRLENKVANSTKV
ncbi:hypothetical protein [Leptospira santarosai]|uniref:hypothetical protein n=1 Tax=Leptospira santarosai TaxID=28183 RepID=UPI000518A90F|nr:hypothetical protein [Leptospira santarosai]MDI7188420.1 hypothetical protein [Leptospira santarosai]MDI7198053.1 hypothetical protein [Leptospira santarosai]MDI7204452.1 hypothetical protein [Leptospira santarosai]MDI7220342.1 hypothetical protein [Leptospira santarosai]